MFSVEKITDKNVFLENIQTGETIKILVSEIQNVKESDIVILKNNKYIYSEEETLKRKEKIKNLKNKLKVKNRG